VTQPDYVPLATADRIRPVGRLPVALGWRADRPSDEANAVVPTGPRFGYAGPDIGYGLKLAKRLLARVHLAAEESADDALWGCFAVGARRGSLFGRAPVVYDFELAFTLWGFLGDAPPDLIAFRVPLFRGVAHSYWDQRGVADQVKEETLRMSPAEVRAALAEWRSLILG
jgi:hypothetical protein